MPHDIPALSDSADVETETPLREWPEDTELMAELQAPPDLLVPQVLS